MWLSREDQDRLLLQELRLRAGEVARALPGRNAVIHIIRTRATAQQVSEMLEELEGYIKLAVDVRRGVLAGGGGLHADCERALLNDGSAQADVWGADWLPGTQEVTFESLINIRPAQGNVSMELQDAALRARVEGIVRARLGDVCGI